MILAPITLFVYNRPWHTQQTIEALQKNALASKSELIIYSDAGKGESDRMGVANVRRYIDQVDGFKKVTIIKREKNYGLANNIIDGVTNIVNQYGKLIVLEDDLVTSPYFLKFMNEALAFYEAEKQVWHISGWNYPIDTDGLDDVFLWRLMNCWGWATWSDRWQYYEKDADNLLHEFSKEDIARFTLDGTVKDFWTQVIANKNGKINTWAIFWYATIFKQNGLCLNPSKTFVENIGLDGSGVHCIEQDIKENALSMKKHIKFNENFYESDPAVKQIKKYYRDQKKFFVVRIINKMARIILNRNLIK